MRCTYILVDNFEGELTMWNKEEKKWLESIALATKVILECEDIEEVVILLECLEEDIRNLQRHFQNKLDKE